MDIGDAAGLPHYQQDKLALPCIATASRSGDGSRSQSGGNKTPFPREVCTLPIGASQEVIPMRTAVTEKQIGNALHRRSDATVPASLEKKDAGR